MQSVLYTENFLTPRQISNKERLKQQQKQPKFFIQE